MKTSIESFHGRHGSFHGNDGSFHGSFHELPPKMQIVQVAPPTEGHIYRHKLDQSGLVHTNNHQIVMIMALVER